MVADRSSGFSAYALIFGETERDPGGDFSPLAELAEKLDALLAP